MVPPRLGVAEGGTLASALLDLSVTVGDTTVPLLVDGVAAATQAKRELTPRSSGLAVTMTQCSLVRARLVRRARRPLWQDKPGAPLERQLREVAASVAVRGDVARRGQRRSS